MTCVDTGGHCHKRPTLIQCSNMATQNNFGRRRGARIAALLTCAILPASSYVHSSAAATPPAATIVTANSAGNSVSQISEASGTVSGTVNVASRAGIPYLDYRGSSAISPDGSTYYVVGCKNGTVPDAGTLTAVNATTG